MDSQPDDRILEDIEATLLRTTDLEFEIGKVHFKLQESLKLAPKLDSCHR